MKVTFSRTLFIILSLALVSGASLAQDKMPPKKYTEAELLKLDKGKVRPPSGPRFEIVFAQGTIATYVVLLHSEDRSFVQDLYHVNQLGVMEAIIEEAARFGPTEEAVGGVKAVTTRFSDPQLPGFFIDVSKNLKETRYYVTLQSSGKKLTIDAGARKRGQKKPEEAEPEPILFDGMLDSIRSAKQPTQ